MNIQLLFLDLNGTIVDDWPASYAGMRANFELFGTHRTPTLQEYIRMVGGNGDYKKMYEDHGITADRDMLYDQAFFPAYAAYTKDFTRIDVFPGVYDTLHALKKNGVELHVLTAARHDLVDRIISTIAIQKYCDGLHCHVHNKEAQVHAIIDGMDIHPDECAMMGDLPSDVTHAKRAGIKGIRFANPDVPDDLFKEVEPDFTAHSFADILGFVF